MAKHCLNCGNYVKLYQRGAYEFLTVSCGKCRKTKKIVSRADRCENWVEEKRKQYTANDIMQRLENTANELEVIKQILQETLL